MSSREFSLLYTPVKMPELGQDWTDAACISSVWSKFLHIFIAYFGLCIDVNPTSTETIPY